MATAAKPLPAHCRRQSLPDTNTCSTTNPTATDDGSPTSSATASAVSTHKFGLNHVKYYGARHFHPTQPLAAGVDVRMVANRMGHARTSTATDVCAQILKSVDQSAADIIHRQAGGTLEVDS